MMAAQNSNLQQSTSDELQFATNPPTTGVRLKAAPPELPAELKENVGETCAALWRGPIALSAITDSRIQALAATARTYPDDWNRVRVAMKETQLSSAYLSVRFKERTGLTLRSYTLWMKLEKAFALSLTGVCPADAAAFAGFTDQSHLGRAARRFAQKSYGKALRDLKEALSKTASG